MIGLFDRIDDVLRMFVLLPQSFECHMNCLMCWGSYFEALDSPTFVHSWTQVALLSFWMRQWSPQNGTISHEKSLLPGESPDVLPSYPTYTAKSSYTYMPKLSGSRFWAVSRCDPASQAAAEALAREVLRRDVACCPKEGSLSLT